VPDYKHNLFSSIAELFYKLKYRNAISDRVSFYGKILKTHITRALRYILPSFSNVFDVSALRDLILLLISPAIKLHKIRYSTIVSLLCTGRRNHKKKQILRSYMYRERLIKYYQKYPLSKYKMKTRPMPKRRTGIPKAGYFDLSFFLKLNYDMDLYKFVAFCRAFCNDYTTLRSAL